MHSQKVIVVTADELREIVREELSRILQRDGTPAPTEFLSADEVAALVGYKRSYVPELIRRHDLPAHQPNGRGARFVFRRDEIEAWVAQRKGKR